MANSPVYPRKWVCFEALRQDDKDHMQMGFRHVILGFFPIRASKLLEAECYKTGKHHSVCSNGVSEH
jgi:hypothetical protein